MPSTVVDFWRMIHDHDSYSIVMLNDMNGYDEVTIKSFQFKYLKKFYIAITRFVEITYRSRKNLEISILQV